MRLDLDLDLDVTGSLALFLTQDFLSAPPVGKKDKRQTETDTIFHTTNSYI